MLSIRRLYYVRAKTGKPHVGRPLLGPAIIMRMYNIKNIQYRNKKKVYLITAFHNFVQE